MKTNRELQFLTKLIAYAPDDQSQIDVIYTECSTDFDKLNHN